MQKQYLPLKPFNKGTFYIKKSLWLVTHFTGMEILPSCTVMHVREKGSTLLFSRCGQSYTVLYQNIQRNTYRFGQLGMQTQKFNDNFSG